MAQATGDLAFVPLGGAGEIGMNLNLYRCDGQWLAVDCGIGFGGSEAPEVEVMMPDPAFIAERRDRLVGLVITHAHEDHLGAIPHLWPQLRCPVYATPFAAAVLRRKLTEAGLLRDVKLHIVQPGGAFALGPFALRFIPVTHSIPEAQALAIGTPHGTVLHTGDWKLDPDPLLGEPTDEAAFRALGDAGVLALVCDSTNAILEGTSRSEALAREGLTRAIVGRRGRIAVTCFATNVARLASVAHAARKAGRSVALVGRSLRNIEAAARECGYLKGVPDFVPEDDVGSVPDDALLILITGSQGEPRSALARVAADTHPNVVLGEGDTVIFSSRIIPGNEKAVGTVQDGLRRNGVTVVTEDSVPADAPIHVSGHPRREELRRMYRLVRPRIAVPVHGEFRHLTEHAELAREMQAAPVLVEDGDVLSLAPGAAEVVDSVPVGRLVLDGNRLVPIRGGVMAARRRMLFNGVVVGSVAVDAAGRLKGRPRISAPGLYEAEDAEGEAVAAELAAALRDLPAPTLRDDAALTDAARTALRRAVGRRLQKKPMVDVHVLRV
jgi:ribonuclease J